MAYCNLSDVQDLTQQVYKVDSRPNINDVQRMINEIASELDGVASAAGYTIPITGTSALEVMRRYNKMGAAVSAWHAGVISESELPRVAYWREEYDNFVGRLRRGEQQLPGETTEGNPQAGFSVAPQRVDGYSDVMVDPGPFLRRRWRHG